MAGRTTDDWMQQLQPGHPAEAAALTDLRAHLLRAARYCLQQRRASLRSTGSDDIEQIAEDCAQDALLAIRDHLAEFRRDSEFTTWAYKFAINIALMAVRREQYKGVALDEVPAESGMTELFVDEHSAGQPERALAQKEVWAIMQDVISHELTDRQRLALRAIVFSEIPMDVVTAHLGINRNAVYKLLHDARRKLKQELELRGYGVQEIMGSFGAQQT